VKRDRISGIVFMLIGAAVLVASLNYPVGTLQKPGGGFFPLLAAALLVGLSAVFTVQCFARRLPGGAAEETGPGSKALRRIAFGVAALVAYRYLIPVVGFAPSTALFIFALSRFLENASWARSLIFAVLAAAASYYLFQVVLKIQMPIPMLRL
jgi:putative tricarboxylic transport membrane protein